MATAIVFLVVVVVGGTIAINLFLRSWVREESRREAHLMDPHTHTVAFAIPTGVDPVVAESALSLAGLTPGTVASAWSSASASSATNRSVTGCAGSWRAS